MRRSEKEVAGIEKIEEIIMASDVCRIAIANDNLPYIVTMNFGYKNINGGKIYFHCSREGHKLEMIRKNNYVCFEFDTAHRLTTGTKGCDYTMCYRSVVGWGFVSIISDDKEKKEGLDSIMEHYTGRNDFCYRLHDFERTIVLRLDIAEMTGKSSGY